MIENDIESLKMGKKEDEHLLRQVELEPKKSEMKEENAEVNGITHTKLYRQA